jgi:hypothetical protein
MLPNLPGCSLKEHTCDAGGCVPEDLVCDGVPHCSDWSDETHCQNDPVTTTLRPYDVITTTRRPYDVITTTRRPYDVITTTRKPYDVITTTRWPYDVITTTPRPIITTPPQTDIGAFLFIDMRGKQAHFCKIKWVLKCRHS